MHRTNLEILTRAENRLARKLPLNEDDRKAILKTRLALIKIGANMEQINRAFPEIDAIMGCDDDGEPVWLDR